MKKENIKGQKNKIKGWNFNQPQECELCSLCSSAKVVEDSLFFSNSITSLSCEIFWLYILRTNEYELSLLDSSVV